AGCNNIVGLKPTSRLLSTEGVVPACRSLDCVSILALTAEDARCVFEVARGDPVHKPMAQTHNLRVTFAVPHDDDLEFFGDDGQALLYTRALRRLEELGARRITFDFKPFLEVASLLYEGPWLAERLAAIVDFLKAHPSALLPVTKSLLEGGHASSAV